MKMIIDVYCSLTIRAPEEQQPLPMCWEWFPFSQSLAAVPPHPPPPQAFTPRSPPVPTILTPLSGEKWAVL